jgi:hypothetical protein
LAGTRTKDKRKGQKGEGPTLEQKGGKRGNLACDKKKMTERREGQRTKKGGEGAWLAIRGKRKASDKSYWIEDNFPRRK